MTMGELCAECRNWFCRSVIRGKFTVAGGLLYPLPEIPDGAYIRIVGSMFNDGVYRYPFGDFSDEEFFGAVWVLAIPPDFVALLDDINAWEASGGAAAVSAAVDLLGGPYISESFAGYTYQRGSGLPDVPTTWRDPRLGFAARLNRWRKI